MEQLLRSFAAASECVVVPTEKIARKYADYIGNTKLEICPSGLELPRMEPFCYRSMLRTRAVVRLLYVGRIAPEKGIPMLLGSLDDLISRGYNVELTLVGPVLAHSWLSRSLRPLARSGNVRLVGTLSGKDLWNQYRRADIFVFPSTTDTQALVLHEAAHAGLPIVIQLARAAPGVSGDDRVHKRHPSGTAPVVVGVPASRDSGQRFSTGHIEDAVHDLVVDPVAADRDEQRPPRHRGSAGQLTGMAGVLGRLGQPGRKAPTRPASDMPFLND